jgi:hypothetical protein
MGFESKEHFRILFLDKANHLSFPKMSSGLGFAS